MFVSWGSQKPSPRMEVSPSGPQALSKSPRRRGTSLPLRPLVEEARSGATGHPLDSKIYAKLKRNSQIEVEPSELHFSGFELGKSYVKVLKVINISSEVVNIHIIPTQTRYFQTTYTKKARLIPGLDLAVKVTFCPDKWCHFNDCIRVHCKDEENLLIPVHGYPVIDDLHIPPRIDLPAVPLGQSVCHAIPLRSSCPVNFEFQLFVIQQHESFSLHPLKGVISASGKEKISVTFAPQQYETSQFTFQLVVSQFNTKPYLCTVTGSSAPHLALSQLTASPGPAGDKRLPPVAKRPPRRKSITSTSRDADNLKRDQSDVSHQQAPPVDICTPAGVAKMLIKDMNKPSSKDLKQALSSVSTTGKQSRQMKEALFRKKLQEYEKEEQVTLRTGKVRLGSDPTPEETRLQILVQREGAQHECTHQVLVARRTNGPYKVKREAAKQAEAFASVTTKLSSTRVIRDVGQPPDGVPCFQLYTSIPWEQKQEALKRFQQAARKVVIRCRMNRRLAALKTLTDSVKNPAPLEKAELKETPVTKLTMDSILPRFPIFSDDEDDEAFGNLAEVPVDPIEVKVTTQVPLLKLQVPQRYKLMGYEPTSSLEAFDDYIPPTLPRPLRSGPPAELEPVDSRTEDLTIAEEEEKFSFKAPDALLRPFPANPLRIFNPAPGLQTYKPTPEYLENDVEFHLCPVPRYEAPERHMSSLSTARASLDPKEAIRELMEWRDFNPISVMSGTSRLTSGSASCRFVNYDPVVLPRLDSRPLAFLPDDCSAPVGNPSPLVQRGAALVSHSNTAAGAPGRRLLGASAGADPQLCREAEGEAAQSRQQNFSITRT